MFSKCGKTRTVNGISRENVLVEWRRNKDILMQWTTKNVSPAKKKKELWNIEKEERKNNGRSKNVHKCNRLSFHS